MKKIGEPFGMVVPSTSMSSRAVKVALKVDRRLEAQHLLDGAGSAPAGGAAG
jgi:hypothetical protein